MYKFTADSLDNVTPELIIDYNYDQLVGSNELTSWKKGLVSVDLNGNKAPDEGESISYDRIGNPTTYLGATLTWFGRQLTSYTTADKTISYKYDSDGLRTEKIVDGVKHEYVYIGDQLHYEKRGSKNIFYFYDCNGYLTGLEYDGTTYYPATTLNGDVVAIYDHNGICLVEYEYDAWGNVISVTNASGNAITDENHIANINPIRYRGYYYDSETGLYYLQSRYYNAKVGRFLNADSQLNQQSGPLGFNMFAYGENNPVMFSDPTGHSIILACLIGGAIIGAITGGAIGASVSKIETGKVSAKAVIGGALAGAVIGGAVGAAMGAVGQKIATKVASKGVSTAIKGIDKGTKSQTTTLYRSVSKPELQDIASTGKFNLSPYGMESKQFGLNLGETQKFGNLVGQDSIISAKIPTNMLDEFCNVSVDPTIFRSGTITVYGEQLEMFNKLVAGTISLVS